MVVQVELAETASDLEAVELAREFVHAGLREAFSIWPPWPTAVVVRISSADISNARTNSGPGGQDGS